ncbi:MAG: DMT family transporter [Gammaproteobacteria bacterium]
MNLPPQETRAVVSNIQCFFSIFLWASGFVALEFLLDDWGAVSLNALRLAVSAIVLLLWWMLREGWGSFSDVPWSRGLSIGAIGWGLGSLMLFLGQRLSDPVTTTIVVAMMPLAGAAIEIAFDKRQLSAAVSLGILLALYGGYLATGVSIRDTEIGVGILLCLVAIFLFAWATRATTRQLDELSPTGQTAVTMMGGALFSCVLYFGFLVSGSDEAQAGEVTVDVLVPFLIYLIPSSGIAQLLWIFGAGRLGIMIASFHMNAAPFYVMLILVALSHGNLEARRALGAGIVIVGVILAQLKIGGGSSGKRKKPAQQKM